MRICKNQFSKPGKGLLVVLSVMAAVTLLLSACHSHDDVHQEEIIGWAAGNASGGFGTIFHTKNGGLDWERQGDATMIPNADLNDIRAVNKYTVWAVGESEGGVPVILKTEDGGRTWVRQGTGSGLPDAALSGVCPLNDNICWAAGLHGTILKTTDGGSNWTALKASNDYAGAYQMIAAADENHVWAVGEGDTKAMIHYTSDGGLTWERQGTDSLTTDNMPNALIDIHAANLNYVWTVGPSQAVYTLDGGKTWVNKPTPVAFYHNNGVCVVNDHVVWVATDDNLIFKLTQLNGDWVHQTSPAGALPAMYMGITATDENTAWITTNTYTNGGQILHTGDGGKTWVIQDTPEDISLRRITFVGAKR